MNNNCMECKHVHKKCDWWCLHDESPRKSKEGIPLDEEIVGGRIVRVIPPSWCPLKREGS